MDAKERESGRGGLLLRREDRKHLVSRRRLLLSFHFAIHLSSLVANSHFEELETLTADITLTSLALRPIPQRSLARALLRKYNAHHRSPTPMPLPARLSPTPPLRPSALTGRDIDSHRLVPGPLRRENHLGRRHLSEILQPAAPLAYSG
jgi:hypothetical protein